MSEDPYVTDTATGDGWTLHLGDSCEVLATVPDESIDLTVFSPPFASLYTYSNSLRDLGNSSTRDQFFEHYGFIIAELLRVTRPGRLSAVHTADLSTTKATHGRMGLYDFPGDVIRAHEAAGWTFYGRALIDKNPQAQAQRTKAHALMFATKNRDSAGTRPAIGDQLLVFKKPGENATPIKTDVTNEEWITWARPIWRGLADDDAIAAMEREGLAPAPGWYDIRETNTLNHRAARDDQDEKHICPLQLDFIERCVRLWSNPGETVLTPFAGVGSEVWTATRLDRRGVGIELKPSYWRTAVDNLRRLDAERAVPALIPA
nr:DNA methyltransferase [Micromonospora sp. DSM 115978]